MKISRIIYMCILASLVMVSACNRKSDGFDKAGTQEDLIDEMAAQWDDNDESDSKPDLRGANDNKSPVTDAEWEDGNYMNFDSTFSINYRSNLPEIFNDSNKYQYAVAERIGISPIMGIEDAYYTRRPLRKIGSCANYSVDNLTHSMPYLVPEAAALLDTIGIMFNARVKALGGSGQRIRVTSVTRSGYSVKKLRHVNINATDSSTHQLATTFDISYARFDCAGGGKCLPDEQLKYVLADVLLTLRRQKKCMVKYEKKTPCFHVSATGR